MTCHPPLATCGWTARPSLAAPGQKPLSSVCLFKERPRPFVRRDTFLRRNALWL